MLFNMHKQIVIYSGFVRLVGQMTERLLYFWGSPDGAQQLGTVAHGGGSVVQRGGELGCLAEVVLLVLRRFVINTWRTCVKK